MRTKIQTKIITLQLERFVSLRVQLEQILSVVNSLIKKGESWIQGNDEIGTFSQVNQLLDFEMATCLKHLFVIAGEKEDDIQISQPLEQVLQERQSPSVKLRGTCATNDNQICGLNDAQSLREELQNLNKKFSLLTTSVESIKEKSLTLNKKYEELNMTSDLLTIKLSSLQDDQNAQKKLVVSVSENHFAADAKNMSRFAEIGTELQAASDFIQSQTEMFDEKLETFKEKCTLQLDERLNNFEFKLKEIFLKEQEESERVISEKINEIKIELNKQTKKLDNLKHEKECLPSKQNHIQKTVSDIPMRINTLEKDMKTIQPLSCTHDLQLVYQATDDNNEKVYESPHSQVLTQASKAEAFVQYSGIVVIGNNETQVAKGGEPELKCCLRDCDKNPGHNLFIPVQEFTLSHLHLTHSSMNVYSVIKASADLTVRVDVKMTSPHRPEFWPKKICSYPFYSLRNQTILRTGSGMVSGLNRYLGGLNQYGNKHVDKYTKCWCKKCQYSVNASHVWWEISVLTATQVVFDDEEARHTSLRLFYDSEDSPLVSVDQVKVVDANVDRDWCMLTCVTCDYSLGEKLNKRWKSYNDLFRKVWDAYKISRDVDKLTFIVSHPHGCSKQVSVGQWEDKYKISKHVNQFTYNSCTCPGSSGAMVHCVGYYATQLVHSGSLSSELNYSGVG